MSTLVRGRRERMASAASRAMAWGLVNSGDVMGLTLEVFPVCGGTAPWPVLRFSSAGIAGWHFSVDTCDGSGVFFTREISLDVDR